MEKLLLDEDIRPLSEFKSKSAAFIKQLHETKRPMVLTQKGRSAAVLLDVQEYEALLEKLEMLEDLQCAENEVDKGAGIEHSEAKNRVLERLDR